MAWLDILEATLTIFLGPPQTQLPPNSNENASSGSQIIQAPKELILVKSKPTTTHQSIQTDISITHAPKDRDTRVSAPTFPAAPLPAVVGAPAIVPLSTGTKVDTSASTLALSKDSVPSKTENSTQSAQVDNAAFDGLKLLPFEPFEPVLLYATPPRVKRPVASSATIATPLSSKVQPLSAVPLSLQHQRVLGQGLTQRRGSLNPAARPFAYPSLIGFTEAVPEGSDTSIGADAQSTVFFAGNSSSLVPNISALQGISTLRIDYEDSIASGKPNDLTTDKDVSLPSLEPARQDSPVSKTPLRASSAVFQRAVTGVLKQRILTVPATTATASLRNMVIVDNAIAVIAKIEASATKPAPTRIIHTPRPMHARVGYLAHDSPRILNPLVHPARPSFLAASCVKVVLKKPEEVDEAVVEKVGKPADVAESAVQETPTKEIENVQSTPSLEYSNHSFESETPLSDIATPDATVQFLPSVVLQSTPAALPGKYARVGRLLIRRDSPRIANPLSHPARPAFLSQSSVKVVLKRPEEIPEKAQSGVEGDLTSRHVWADEMEKQDQKDAPVPATISVEGATKHLFASDDLTRPGDVFSATLDDPIIHLPLRFTTTRVGGMSEVRPASVTRRKSSTKIVPSVSTSQVQHKAAVKLPRGALPFEQHIRACVQVNSPPKVVCHATHSYAPANISIESYKLRVSVFADAAAKATSTTFKSIALVAPALPSAVEASPVHVGRWETVPKPRERQRIRTTTNDENRKHIIVSKGIEGSVWATAKKDKENPNVRVELEVKSAIAASNGKSKVTASSDLVSREKKRAMCEDVNWWRTVSAGRKVKESLLSPQKSRPTRIAAVGQGRWITGAMGGEK